MLLSRAEENRDCEADALSCLAQLHLEIGDVAESLRYQQVASALVGHKEVEEREHFSQTHSLFITHI